MTHEIKREDGFTLVELSIVLVIIGLIIGGILAGQDMIRAAEVRSTIAQIEKFNTSVNTFRDKYAYIPGDMNSIKAGEFGFETRTGAVGHGDANGRLEGCAAGAVVFGCETALFWRDMAQVGLVGEDMNYATDALANAAAIITGPELPDFIPEASLGRGNFFNVFNAAGINYYQLTGVSDIAATGAQTLVNALTPQESENIDNKMDDGRPLTGVVRAMEGTGPLNTAVTPATAAVGVCVDSGGANNPYNNTTEDFANTPACQLRMRFN